MADDEERSCHALRTRQRGRSRTRCRPTTGAASRSGLAVSFAFLGVLFWRLPEVSLGDVLPDLTAATAGWVVFAIAIHVVAYVLQTLRWSLVSDTMGIHLPFRRMFSHLLAGEFVSNALPTSFGGDVRPRRPPGTGHRRLSQTRSPPRRWSA